MNTKVQTRPLYLTVLYWSAPTLIVCALSAFIVVSTLVGVFPETFGPMFGSLINYHEGGIYADCSLAKNRKNSICTGRKNTNDKTWNSVKSSTKGSVFTLYGN